MVKSKLPNSVLRRVWMLSDIDEDGMLDRDEFAVAMFLIDHKLSGNDLPETLPDRVVPPSKKKYRQKPSASLGGRRYQSSEQETDPAYRSMPPSYYGGRQMNEYDDHDEAGGLSGFIDH